MKPLIRRTLWLALTGLLATTAFAQKEQWLKYQASPEGKSYRYVQVTSNAPPNVPLPQLNGPAFFARWLTPMDPSGGRWLCFDRSRRSGPYDRLYFDSTGNGRLDDKTPIITRRAESYSTAFEPVKVVFKGEDGPITYHVLFNFMKFQGAPPRLLASSGGSYSGMVDLGGKKRHLELVDANVNGSFNDISAEPTECDRMEIANDKAGERMLGQMIEADGQFYKIQVARDGAFVKLAKADNVALGRVHVPDTISEVSAFGPMGQFLRRPVKGDFTLPVGTYSIHEWSASRKDAKGVAWRLEGSRTTNSACFTVSDTGPATVEIGEPIKIVLDKTEYYGTVLFNLAFEDRFHERITIAKGVQSPPGPKLTLVSTDGSYRSTNSFEFG